MDALIDIQTQQFIKPDQELSETFISSNGWHSGPIFFKPEKN